MKKRVAACCMAVLITFLPLAACTGAPAESISSSLSGRVDASSESDVPSIDLDILMDREQQNDDLFTRIVTTFYGDAETSHGFAWRTGTGLTASDVAVFPMENGRAVPEKVRVFSGESGEAPGNPDELWHKAAAYGLSPGSIYMFRVGDAAQNLWGPFGSFGTAGSGEGYQFVFITDTHGKNKEWAEVAATTLSLSTVKEKPTEFFLHGGDIVNNGDEDEQWAETLGAMQPILRHTTLVPAAGNHDYGDQMFSSHFNLLNPEGSGTSEGVYYSFTYGPVHYVVLNTNHASEQYGCISSTQAEWLRTDVEAARAEGAKRIVVLMHKAPYSLSAHVNEDEIILMREKVPPLFEELEVDLVLQGHDHFPSRTLPLREGAFAEEGGVVYVNGGMAGLKGYLMEEELPWDYLNLFRTWIDRQDDEGRYQYYTVVDVSPDGAMQAELYEIDQEAEGKPQLVDSYTIPDAEPLDLPAGLPQSASSLEETFPASAAGEQPSAPQSAAA